MAGTDMARALDVETNSMDQRMAAAVKHGAVVKKLVGGRVIYSLPNDDDGAPVRRTVTTPSTRPSADALASANPFGALTKGAEPSGHIPQFVPRLECIPEEPQTRFGIFSDGVIVIESGPARIELAATDAAKLRRLLEVGI